MNGEFHLHRNALGQLVFTGADGRRHVDVEPARAFPISAAHESISVLSSDGHELAWIERLNDLPDKARRLLVEELEGREFMPEILRVHSVSGYAPPCTWHVETDRGDTKLVLNTEEDIKRLAAPTLLIVDNRGIQFLIRNPRALDSNSRRILDRFL